AVMKQVDEDNIRTQAIIDLAMLFDKASTTNDDMINAYKECKDISKERRVLIETILKDEFWKDYETHND
nr:hypothetical protein [Tanacetum cinerariifolium]